MKHKKLTLFGYEKSIPYRLNSRERFLGNIIRIFCLIGLQVSKKRVFGIFLVAAMPFVVHANDNAPSTSKINKSNILIPQYRIMKSMCGPFCISFASKWCGKTVSVKEATELSNWMFDKTSLFDLKKAAIKIGLHCDVIRFSPVKAIKFLHRHPESVMIGSFEENHFLVLAGSSHTSARLIDPLWKKVKQVKSKSSELIFANDVPVLVISPERTPFIRYKKIGIALLVITIVGGVLVLCRMPKRRHFFPIGKT